MGFYSLAQHLKSKANPIKKKVGQKPFIVFESDDWGMSRMPSLYVKNKILAFYPSLKDNPYLEYDCLERSEDLDALFNVLSSHEDSFGISPKITANFVSQNPDFSQIEKSRFAQYFGEPFQDTYKRFPGCESTFVIQKDAFNEQLFIPQFHGREHVHVLRWMNDLGKDENLKMALHYGLVNYVTDSVKKSPCISQYMDAMNAQHFNELNSIIKFTLEGLLMFKDAWGFTSITMIAPCYFWHPLLEDAVIAAGIKAFQGLRIQKIPLLKNDPYRYAKVHRRLGEKNKNGQYYLVRNAFFEPSTDSTKDWVNCCLKEIVNSIRECGIAIVSVHRVNFMGGIDIGNRDRNLILFNKLLCEIEKIFPQFSYASSCDVIQMLEEVNNENK